MPFFLWSPVCPYDKCFDQINFVENCLIEKGYEQTVQSQFKGYTSWTAWFPQTTHIWPNRHLKRVKVILGIANFQWCPMISKIEPFVSKTHCSVFPPDSAQNLQTNIFRRLQYKWLEKLSCICKYWADHT